MPTAITSRTNNSPQNHGLNTVYAGFFCSFVLLCVLVCFLPLSCVCFSTWVVRCSLLVCAVLSLLCTLLRCFTFAFTGGRPVVLSAGNDVSKITTSVSLWLFCSCRVVSLLPISTLTMLSSHCWLSLFSSVCVVCSVVAFFELLQLARNGAIISVSTRRNFLHCFSEFIHVTA